MCVSLLWRHGLNGEHETGFRLQFTCALFAANTNKNVPHRSHNNIFLYQTIPTSERGKTKENCDFFSIEPNAIWVCLQGLSQTWNLDHLQCACSPSHRVKCLCLGQRTHMVLERLPTKCQNPGAEIWVSNPRRAFVAPIGFKRYQLHNSSTGVHSLRWRKSCGSNLILAGRI